ncbi:hypothetical protein [Streptomyces sp. BA2]|uniref:hypothetical protein n=1 Tax=Streptomyces sp. BA2 TaxID=436595 RepID=UPI001923ED9C|nr:hypothetical protein [Streptomyces sp. BA2]
MAADDVPGQVAEAGSMRLWLGEVEGLQVSFGAAMAKLNGLKTSRADGRPQLVDLGIPAFTQADLCGPDAASAHAVLHLGRVGATPRREVEEPLDEASQVGGEQASEVVRGKGQVGEPRGVLTDPVADLPQQPHHGAFGQRAEGGVVAPLEQERSPQTRSWLKPMAFSSSWDPDQ